MNLQGLSPYQVWVGMWRSEEFRSQAVDRPWINMWWGWLTLNLERICKDFGRIASDSADPGGGGQSTLNLERIHKDFGRITSDNVDLGGLIDTQLEKDPQRLWEDHLWQCWSGGGWSTLNLERICKDFGRITSDNIDLGGSIDTQLEKDPQRLLEDHFWQCWSGVEPPRINIGRGNPDKSL